MIVPKLPLDFSTDQVIPNFKFFNIDGAGLRLLCRLRANVLQCFSLFLEDNDPSWRVLVIWVLVQELSLVFLIDRKDILTNGLYFHQQVS